MIVNTAEVPPYRMLYLKKILLVRLERQIGNGLYTEGLSISLALTIINCVLLDSWLPLSGAQIFHSVEHDNP